MRVEQWNKLLVATVIVLLWVATLALIKVLFSGSNGFEWGSVSDWLSSLATIGTLGIAIAAYKKAPEWLAQKQYDIAHQLIEDAIYNDLQQVRSASLILKTRYLMFSRSLISVLNNNTLTPDSLTSAIISLDSLIDEYRSLGYSVINALNKIVRNGFELSEYSSKIINTLQEAEREYSDIYNAFFLAQAEVDSLIHADIVAKDMTINEFKVIQKDAIKVHNMLSELTSTIYKNNYPINKFIVRKKIIHE